MDLNPESKMSTNRDRSHQFITRKRIDEHRRPCSSFGIVEATSSSYNSGGVQSSLDEEEEEDMANCLTMLAQSVSPLKEHKLLDHYKTSNLKIRPLNEIITTTTTTGPNPNFQNYECRTCNRAFATFQALGGHRASQKKPKHEDRNSLVSMKMDLLKDDQPKLNLSDHEENKLLATNNNYIQSGYKNKKVNVHECSICGSEFFSGQALGGHMRRHRTIPPITTQITAKSHDMSLDLNLPPSEAVNDVHLQQRPLVFSAASLVDCHY
ncbi:zinc finger protein ZAT5-like [Rutidosis leptorrhynchoides]|uniref:zinc finger protein ZAT5-like n=1 Tax=Rutidosis leptorrhynchoides TaxID=125765 RepID=UPI003A9A4968